MHERERARKRARGHPRRRPYSLKKQNNKDTARLDPQPRLSPTQFEPPLHSSYYLPPIPTQNAKTLTPEPLIHSLYCGEWIREPGENASRGGFVFSIRRGNELRKLWEDLVWICGSRQKWVVKPSAPRCQSWWEEGIMGYMCLFGGYTARLLLWELKEQVGWN